MPSVMPAAAKTRSANRHRGQRGLARARAAARTFTLRGRNRANGPTLLVEDNSFDGVVGQHVVEHLDDGDALLTEWHRVLRPGGRVALATPNAKYPDPDLFYDPDHRLIYSKTDLVALLVRTGFVVERWYTLAPYLGNRRLTSKAARWLLGLRYVPFFAELGSALHVMARKPLQTEE